MYLPKSQRKRYFSSLKTVLNQSSPAFWPGKAGLPSSTDYNGTYAPIGECERSEQILSECFDHVDHPEKRARLMRMRSKNFWLRNNFVEAKKVLLSALGLLGVHIGVAPTREQADEMFEEVSLDLLTLGRDAILNLPRASDSKVDLAVALLNDAGTFDKPQSGSLSTIYLYRYQSILQRWRRL